MTSNPSSFEAGVQMGDEQDEQRREMADQVKQILSGISIGAWQAFIDQLAHPPEPPPQPAPAAELPPEWGDPVALAERLADLSVDLSDDYKRDIAARLAPVGIVEVQIQEVEVEVVKEVEVIKEVPREVIKEVIKEVRVSVPAAAPAPAAAAAIPPELMAELRKHLQLGPTDPVDLARLVELFGAYHETVVSLQSLVHRAWKQILNFAATNATGLKQATPKFLAGDSNISIDQVSSDLDRLTTIVAGLIGAIANVGRNFANSHMAMVSPSMIEDVVRGEKRPSLMKRLEVCCWEEYVTRFNQITGDSIEREILREVGKYAKQMLDARHPGK
jgi:hypothetical protein